ncbi:hypothetical protein OBJ68_05325 [Empedobacter falsenii]
MKEILFVYKLLETDNEYVKRLVEIISTINNVRITNSLEEFWQPTKNYDLIIINWPEYLFKWRRNLEEVDIQNLKKQIGFHKKNTSKIMSIVHDEYAHHTKTIYRDQIFDICYEQSDILAHLGSFSKTLYKEKYKNLPIQHYLLFHPLYKEFAFNLDQIESKKHIKIAENKNIIFVPGSVRDDYEYKLILKTFSQINLKNKILLIQKVNSEIVPKRYSFQHFKLKFKKLYLRYFRGIIIGPNKHVTPLQLSYYFAASSIVLLSRYRILNSGNVYLANQFNKKIIGFETGNITEWLRYGDDIVIDQNNLSLINIENLNAKSNKNKFLKFHSDNNIKEQFTKIISSL